MNESMYNSMKSTDPLFLIDVIKKIIENCLDFRKKLSSLKNFRANDLLTKEDSSEYKDFLLIIDILEFELQNSKKVMFFIKNLFIYLKIKKELENQFLLENFKNKIILIEKHNSIIINNTNKVIKEYADDMKKLIEISKEKDLTLLNFDEELKKKKEMISKVEYKLYSIPALNHKINFLSAEFEREKKKLNEANKKKIQMYEKILQKEKNKSTSLLQQNRNLNESCDESLFLNRQVKNLEKELIRIKRIIISQNSFSYNNNNNTNGNDINGSIDLIKEYKLYLISILCEFY